MLAAMALAAAAAVADDDHGDSVETATLLPIGPPRSGALTNGDVDVFRLDLAGAASIAVQSSGRIDTRGELLDASGARVGSDDDGGPGGHNFRIEADLAAGVYYLAVSGAPGAAGDYSVTARLADALDQSDTAATAALLTLHGEDDLAAVSVDILLGLSGRIWPSTDDVDVFRIDVPHDDTAVTVRTSGASLHARLLDSSLAEIASDDDGNVRLEAELDAGAYYVVIGGHEVGGYRVLAEGAPTGCPCAEPPTARDDGGSPESSTLLAVGGAPAAGAVADDADVDVFRLDLTGDATVEVRTSGPTDTRAELLDAAGALIASDDGSGPGGHNFRIEEALAAGIYYVAVSVAAAGDYSVMARLGGAPDHGDTAAASTRLTVYGEADLARVTPDILLGASGRIFPSGADIDAFRLDIADDGTDVTVRTGGRTALHGRLVDGSLTEVASDDRGGNVRIETRLDAGIYYLLLGGHERGNYRVLASGTDRPCPCADAEGGDTTEDSTEDGADDPPPTATYRVTFTAQWNAADHGLVPGGAHFTTLAGAAVNADADLWTPGQLASPGLELLAELGIVSTFLTEVAAATRDGDSGPGVTSPGTGATGTSTFELTVSRELPYFTFGSMIAPSPDWFVGLSEFPLQGSDGRWIDDTDVMGLPAWDAGTETGNRYTLSGPDTIPPQPIRLLTETVNRTVEFENGTVDGNYLATIRFERVSQDGGTGVAPPRTKAPAFTEGTSTLRFLRENTPAGTAIGAPLTAIDPEGEAVTYRLRGADASSFELAQETGQLLTRAGAVYDFEGRASYRVRVTGSDPHGATSSIDVTVEITDDDTEAPGRPSEPVVTGATLTSLTVAWAPPANTGPPIHAYEIGYRRHNSGGYEIVRVPGTATSATVAGLNHATAYQVLVQPFNAEGAGARSPRANTATRAPPSDTPVRVSEGAADLIRIAGAGVPVTLIDRLFGTGQHGERISRTFTDTLSDGTQVSFVQSDGGDSFHLGGVLLTGHDDFLIAGFIRHALAYADGVVWTASDQTTRYKPGDVAWVLPGARPFRRTAVAFASWMRGQDVLLVSSMENASSTGRADGLLASAPVYCDDFDPGAPDGWIPLCGEVDDYIAHSGVGLDRTVFAGAIEDGYARGAVRGDGVFAPHSIWVESPDGSTSHATAVLAAYATELKAANPYWGAARLREELMRVARERDYPYYTGGSNERGTALVEQRSLRVILGEFAPGTGNRFPGFLSPAAYAVAENGTAVGTVTADDEDPADEVTGYRIAGGADAADFAVSNQGALAFRTAPDFEAPRDRAGSRPAASAGDNDYVVVVEATGGAAERRLTAQHRVVVTVTDVAE